MPIDAREVRRIAALARLELDPDSVEGFRHQLGAILDHMTRLSDLDLDRVPPTTHGPRRRDSLRQDRAVDPLARDEALSNAPDADADHFRVPRVLEG